MKLINAMLLLYALGAASSLAGESAGLELQRITDNVYAIVGERGNRNPVNLANNATFGVVVTAEGVLLIDPGGSERGAMAIERMVRGVTDKPVVAVINTGGQDHRWFGNDYFQRQGARIIASEAAVADQRGRAQDQFIVLDNLVGKELMEGTRAAHASETFSDEYTFTLGDVRVEVRHAGAAHTPGDSFVWLPQQRVVFTGDIVYVERMLGVIAVSDSANWLEVFDLVASHQPDYLVPGHGSVTDLETARQDTRDYLAYLRERVAAFIDDGRDLSEIGTIDQSGWSYLQNFETLSGRNAHQVFTHMEWE